MRFYDCASKTKFLHLQFFGGVINKFHDVQQLPYITQHLSFPTLVELVLFVYFVFLAWKGVLSQR